MVVLLAVIIVKGSVEWSSVGEGVERVVPGGVEIGFGEVDIVVELMEGG
jgi:hypothetical protein